MSLSGHNNLNLSAKVISLAGGVSLGVRQDGARSSSPPTSLRVFIGSRSDCFFPEHSQLFYSIFGIRRQAGRSLSQGNLTEDNFKSIEGKREGLTNKHKNV